MTPSSHDASVPAAGAHWLLEAARRVLPAECAASLPAELPRDVAEAWRAVTTATGLSSAELTRAAAESLKLPVADLASVDAQAARLVPERVARKYAAIPLRATDSHVDIATSDPTDFGVERDLEFATGRAVRFALAEPDAIAAALDVAYSPARAIETIVQGFGTSAAPDVVLEDDLADGQSADPTTGAVRRLTATLLRDAVQQGASDVHLAPVGTEGVVRYRVDGVMRQVLTMPAPVYTHVISRIKVIGRLDITDRLRPQDGRGRIVVAGEPIDIRLSTLPVEGGAERVVLRLLRHEAIASLDAMEMAEPERTQLLQLLGAADGLVLMTGPTGSGKTTTLHAALRHRMSDDVTIMTVENPVEYRIPGVAQVQVEPKQDLTFASALRAMMRQDPDIILVGEIRDEETAVTAAQAALTGHLVLSTVHAEDAPAALLRLRDLGLDMSTAAQAFRGTAAQRLLRRLCPACRGPVDPAGLSDDEHRFERLAGRSPGARAVGCAECAYAGYKGRLPIHQVFQATEAVTSLIRAGGDLVAISAQARADGMRSLGESAATRILGGETTVAEAVRVLGRRFWDELELGRSDAPALEVADPDVPSVEARAEGEHRVVVYTRFPERIAELSRACVAAGAEVVSAASPAELAALVREGAGARVLVADLQWDVTGRSEKAVGQLVDLRRVVGDIATPLVLIIPKDHPFLVPLLTAAGISDYLEHPVEPSVLTARVRAALHRASRGMRAVDAA